MPTQPEDSGITESGLSARMERRLRLEEAGIRPKRTRHRVTPCVMPDCENSVWRANRFPLCINHLLVIWKHVDEGSTIEYWQKRDGTIGSHELDQQPHVITEEELEARRLAARQRQREIATKPGHLYVLDTQNETVKIGWTSRELWQRLDQYPPHFRLIVSIPGTRADERDVHRSLKLFRASGREWYNIAPEVVRQINTWIALRNMIEVRWVEDYKRRNPNADVSLSPSILPKFTTLAEWTRDGRVGPYARQSRPAPQSRSAARRVG